MAGPVLAAPTGRRARAVPHHRHVRLRDRVRAGAHARRARPLRAPRRHLLAGGDVRRRRAAPRWVARARRDGDRADARRHLPGRARLGLRRPLHLGRARGLRGPGGPGSARRRGPPGGARRCARRRLQPPRAGQRGADLVRPVRAAEPRDALGPGARLLSGRSARVGDPERRALGARLPGRRTAARRRPRRSTTTRGRTCSPSWPSGCGR